jgi:cytochrome c biogenesis protein
LPFTVELRKFIVEYYSTGMPKLFASEIVLHDRDTGQATPARVEVNHPVSHRGITIYQSSFDDGGSKVKLMARALSGPAVAQTVSGTVGEGQVLQMGAERMTLEIEALRVINVENMNAAAGETGVDVRKVDLGEALKARLGTGTQGTRPNELRNVGPSITYKLRDAAGQAREFHNYMLPVDMKDGGVPVFLLGVRENPAESFRYLRIPADEEGALAGFERLRLALADSVLRQAAVARYARKAIADGREAVQAQLAESAARVLDVFAGEVPDLGAGGLQAVATFLERNVPEAERERAGSVLVRILNGSLMELDALAREKAGLPPAAGETHERFMSQAIVALSDARLYPVPVAFQLGDFEHVQASVFQVAKAPGKWVVYLGCTLLIIGVFAMLYVRERRLWIWLAPSAQMPGRTWANMALSSNRRALDTDHEFALLRDRLLGPKNTDP